MNRNPYDMLKGIRKQGRDPFEVLKEGREIFAELQNDLYCTRAFAWILYDAIKASSDQSEATKTLLAKDFLSLNLTEQDMAASMILTQVLKWEDYPYQVRFIKAWLGKFALRADDLQDHKMDNGLTASSLNIKIRRAVCKYWARHNSINQEFSAWVDAKVEEWIGEGEDDLWFTKSYGQGLLANGQKEEARLYICKLLQKKINEGWAWNLLAELCIGFDDAELAVRKYATALTQTAAFWSAENTQRLIRLLVENNDYQTASWVVQEYRNARQENKWQEHDWLSSLAKKSWITKEVTEIERANCEADAKRVYFQLMGLEPVSLSVTHQNQDKQLVWVEGEGFGCPLPYRIFPQAPKLKKGEAIYAYLDTQDNKRTRVLWYEIKPD